MRKVIDVMKEVLTTLSGKLDGFYLAGGTALSLYYFKHRESYDLDFFTKDFQKPKIETLVQEISESLKLKHNLVAEINQRGRARVISYKLEIVDGDRDLKIDFVQDPYRLLSPKLKVTDGIPVLSREDIYLRKIYAICGSFSVIDEIGRTKPVGGRQEAKDLFDLYFLSTTFIPLSKFLNDNCSLTEIESVIIWFRSFSREDMKLGLGEIMTDKKVEMRDIDRHFRAEIEIILKEQI